MLSRPAARRTAFSQGDGDEDGRAHAGQVSQGKIDDHEWHGKVYSGKGCGAQKKCARLFFNNRAHSTSSLTREAGASLYCDTRPSDE